MKWFSLLSVVFLMLATLLSASPVAYADEPTAGESNIAIDIRVIGTTQVHVTARDGSQLDVGAQGTGDTHMHFIADADTVFDIYITGDGEADIDVSGACELNIKVEGPSEVHIDAGDEVRLNVEASDESQVFVDDEKANDNPGEDSNLDIEASDASEVFIDDESLDNPSLKLDDDTSRLNSPAIISGVFAAAGLLAFFLVRRKAKKG